MKTIILLLIIITSCKCYKANELRDIPWEVDSIKNNYVYAHSKYYILISEVKDTFTVGNKYYLVENYKGEIKKRMSKN